MAKFDFVITIFDVELKNEDEAEQAAEETLAEAAKVFPEAMIEVFKSDELA